MLVGGRAGAKVLKLEDGWSILGMRDVTKTSRVRKAGTRGARSHRILQITDRALNFTYSL